MFNSKSNIPEERLHRVRILGTGAAAPTLQAGNGITVTRTSEGLIKFTFAKNPGTFVGFSANFGAATPADVKGHTATRDTMVNTTSSADAYIEVAMYDSVFAVDDLEANEYLDLTFVFAAQSVIT